MRRSIDTSGNPLSRTCGCGRGLMLPGVRAERGDGFLGRFVRCTQIGAENRLVSQRIFSCFLRKLRRFLSSRRALTLKLLADPADNDL